MCGINGFVQFKRILDSGEMYRIVHHMDEEIIHRGPDAEGIFSDCDCALGMRRLSIIDIESGYQPIWNKDKTMCIIFNGELYNYRELRKRLVEKGLRFSTLSDTEVVLLGIENEGLDFLDKMEGMYAFCIYDKVKREWLLVRDRFGEKPLYYHIDTDKLIFASELKSILHSNLVEKRINEDALSIYIQLSYIPSPFCIIDGIYKLPPASYMTVSSDGKVSINKYWELDIEDDELLSSDYGYAKKKLREALYKSVENRMISDVPLGGFLSGGFDSTIITGIMADISSEPIDTFTIGFNDKEYDESELASLVSKHHGTRHHELILDWNEASRDLERILDNMDEPFADQSLIATYAVSKMTKDYVTVALTGDGGDELFAGYNNYLISYYSNLYNKIPKPLRKVLGAGIHIVPSRNPLRKKMEKVINSASYDICEQRIIMMCRGFRHDAGRVLLQKEINNLDFIKEMYEKYSNTSDEQKRTQYVDLNISLEGCMLTKVDRASMLASLETRVPMLGRDVVELAFKMPSEYKIKGKNRKIILKDTFNDLIPKEIYSAPKRGFNVPIGSWLEGKLLSDLQAYSKEDFLREQGIFSYDAIQSMIYEHIYHLRSRDMELWTFFVFQHWYMNYIM